MLTTLSHFPFQFFLCDVLLMLCDGRPLYGHSSFNKVGGAADKLCKAVVKVLRHRVIHRKEISRRRRGRKVGDDTEHGGG